VREIYQSAHFLITLDDEHRLIRRQRTELGYESIAEVETAYRAVLEAAEHLHRPDHLLLADMRQAPPRNDPTFERAVALYYDRLYAGFRKISALVKTEAGRLQIIRLMSPSVAPRMRVFTNEQAALDHLLKPPSGPPPPGRRPR
jgi:hypothetical protein